MIGFVGVLCVIQPGLAGFKPAALFAVLGVIFLALRDAITRSISVSIPAIAVSFGLSLRCLWRALLPSPLWGLRPDYITKSGFTIDLNGCGDRGIRRCCDGYAWW